MNYQIGFIIKVLLLSLALSMLIKYGGPFLTIAPTALNALLAITIPPLLISLALVGRLIVKQKVES